MSSSSSSSSSVIVFNPALPDPVPDSFRAMMSLSLSIPEWPGTKSAQKDFLPEVVTIISRSLNVSETRIKGLNASIIDHGKEYTNSIDRSFTSSSSKYQTLATTDALLAHVWFDILPKPNTGKHDDDDDDDKTGATHMSDMSSAELYELLLSYLPYDISPFQKDLNATIYRAHADSLSKLYPDAEEPINVSDWASLLGISVGVILTVVGLILLVGLLLHCRRRQYSMLNSENMDDEEHITDLELARPDSMYDNDDMHQVDVHTEQHAYDSHEHKPSKQSHKSNKQQQSTQSSTRRTSTIEERSGAVQYELGDLGESDDDGDGHIPPEDEEEVFRGL